MRMIHGVGVSNSQTPYPGEWNPCPYTVLPEYSWSRSPHPFKLSEGVKTMCDITLILDIISGGYKFKNAWNFQFYGMYVVSFSDVDTAPKMEEWGMLRKLMST